MYFELKENKPHGTKDDPFSTYHIKNEGRSFQIPVHWHDELEIIYVKSGFLTVSISGENYIGTPGDAFVVSPGNLHFMGSQAGEVDYFTFLFPLEYISFCTDDMLDDKLLTPLKNGHLMIRPRIKDAAKELCEQLAEIYMAKNDEKKLEIAVQIKTKIILLQFILHMWENGFIIENDKSGRNTVEKEMISYIQQSFTREISLKELGEQFYLSEKYVSQYFKEHFSYYAFKICYIFAVGACKTVVTKFGHFSYRGCNAQWLSECKLFYQKLQKNIRSVSVKI